MKSTIKNQKGFTMIDTVLATGIIAIGLVAGMFAMQGAAVSTVNQDMNTLAIELANEKIESVLADNEYRGFDYLTASSYPTEILDNSYGMARTTLISEVSTGDLITDEAGSGMKRVEVTVAWGSGDTQNVVVSTLVADYD